MQTTSTPTPQEIERRKAAASAVLRWMNEGITQAPEDHIRALEDTIVLSVCRTALHKTLSSGEKLPASVLCSIDGTRLNKLHLATVHDPSSGDGRKSAGENTVQASKFLNLEHLLIDNDLIQYTVAPDAARIGVQSRHDRANAATYLIGVIDEMRGN